VSCPCIFGREQRVCFTWPPRTGHRDSS